MRARYRCKDNFQGDRCTLAVGHESGTHNGTFSTWDAARAATRPEHVMPFKRSRSANNAMRRALSYNGPQSGLKEVISVLGDLIKFYRGEK